MIYVKKHNDTVQYFQSLNLNDKRRKQLFADMMNILYQTPAESILNTADSRREKELLESVTVDTVFVHERKENGQKEEGLHWLLSTTKSILGKFVYYKKYCKN